MVHFMLMSQVQTILLKVRVLYKFAPLSYIAKHDNFGNEAELSSTANQDIAHTTRYLYSEIETKLSTIPSNYMFADHEYWRSIIPQFFGFPAFRKDGSGNLRYTKLLIWICPHLQNFQVGQNHCWYSTLMLGCS